MLAPPNPLPCAYAATLSADRAILNNEALIDVYGFSIATSFTKIVGELNYTRVCRWWKAILRFVARRVTVIRPQDPAKATGRVTPYHTCFLRSPFPT